MRLLIKGLILLFFVQGCAATKETKKEDYLWLEGLKTARSLDWVKEQNANTINKLGSGQRFKNMNGSILGRLNKKEKLQTIFFLGNEIARISRNSDDSKGILESVTLEESRKTNPLWRKLVDFDVLNKSESKEFVFGSSVCNLNKINQCLLGLSIKGADKEEFREYDLKTGEFIENGFVIPAGITNVTWVDGDTLMFASSFEGETVSKNGYGTTLKLWKRGTDIRTAKKILHITKGNGIAVQQFVSRKKDFVLVHHWLDFYNGVVYSYKDNELKKVNLPTSLELYGVHKGFAVLKLYQEWNIKGNFYPTGSLVGFDLEASDFNNPKIELIFEQTEHESFDLVYLTKSKILLNVIDDMKTKPLVLERTSKPTLGKGWDKQYIQKPSNDVLRIRDTSFALDEAIVGYRGFLTPNNLYFLNTITKNHRFWASAPKAFDTSNLAFSYHFAEGKDGVKIPYQMVGPNNFDPNKRYPVIVYVYGAYGDPTTAWYSSDVGKEWLEKGGIFVIANARGGGAYGERWHQAAIRTTKHKTSDDVATVARDLIERKITTNKKIGVYGVSLGGFAACSVITTYPEIFNAALCKSPITDLMRYTKLSNGSSWIEELGNPDLLEEREYLLKHSPHHAVKKGINIPTILFITHANDDRVHPSHARRMVAKMQEVGLEAYLYESPEGGHNGATTKAERAKIKALEYEYFKQRLFD